MKDTFWSKQPTTKQKRYLELLAILGKLSGLFSESPAPYLYYRAHEKLFCDVFGAYDLSRGDISFDAKQDELGIGLKTFLHGTGKTLQKVAEFNADSDILRGLATDQALVEKVSHLRNLRLQNTLNQTETDRMLYSLVTREEGVFHISEYPMDTIDLDRIRNIKSNKNTVHFDDGLHQYSFSKSKSTLMKRFLIQPRDIITTIPIKVLENPFDVLEQLNFELGLTQDTAGEEIYLPLYAPSSKDREVAEKSGLNQWNAGGRSRHEDELYIPIPSFIHRDYPTFFNYENQDTPPFRVLLPNGRELSCKVCQSDGKALMSNPNLDLGRWLLRDVLEVAPWKLVTKAVLTEIGIDSVRMVKLEEGVYTLDFSKTGSFESFLKNTSEKEE